MHEPTVTVVIPTYNRPDLVGRALTSVLEQTFRDFEVIVVDDGTEKRAKGVIEAFGDPRIHYIQHETNKGCSAAKNTGARNAHGTYVAFLDDDDEWKPEKLATQVVALEEAPEDVGFSFHAALEHFDHGDVTTVVREGVHDYYEDSLHRFSGFIASSLMIKRAVFEKVGYLDETFPSHTDIEFILRIIKGGWRGVGINKPLVYRAGGEGHVQMGSNYQNRIKGRLMLFERYKEDFDKHPHFFANHVTRLGMFYRHELDWDMARKTFARAFGIEPSAKRALLWLSSLGGGIGYRLFRAMKGKEGVA